VTTLAVRRLDSASLVALADAPLSARARLTDEHRASLASRFRAVGGVKRRRLDAWACEEAPSPSAFRWTPRRARRTIGRAGLRRFQTRAASSVTAGVADEIDELFVRAAAGFARPGSLAYWVAGLPSAAVAATGAHAVGWATTTLVTLEPLTVRWSVCESDAFYDVAAARTSLRGRRDAVLTNDGSRTIVRLRGGHPGSAAGAGLRADLVVDALCDREGLVANRIIGLWPDAGIALGLDGTLEDARSGARSLVRAAVRQQRAARTLVA
jgi:hypothetical protein